MAEGEKIIEKIKRERERDNIISCTESVINPAHTKRNKTINAFEEVNNATK